MLYLTAVGLNWYFHVTNCRYMLTGRGVIGIKLHGNGSGEANGGLNKSRQTWTREMADKMGIIENLVIHLVDYQNQNKSKSSAIFDHRLCYWCSCRLTCDSTIFITWNQETAIFQDPNSQGFAGPRLLYSPQSTPVKRIIDVSWVMADRWTGSQSSCRICYLFVVGCSLWLRIPNTYN